MQNCAKTNVHYVTNQLSFYAYPMLIDHPMQQLAIYFGESTSKTDSGIRYSSRYGQSIPVSIGHIRGNEAILFMSI